MALSAHARNYGYCETDEGWIEGIIRDTRLSSSARHIAHVLALLQSNGRVVATLADLSRASNIRSFNTIIAARNELERAGHLRVERTSPRHIKAIVLLFLEDAR